MTRQVISENTLEPTGRDCGDTQSKQRFAQRHGLSASQVDDLCRRVGSGSAALEAALDLMKLYGLKTAVSA